MNAAIDALSENPVTHHAPAPRRDFGGPPERARGRAEAAEGVEGLVGAAPLPKGALGDDGAEGSAGSKVAAPWVISTYFAEGLPWSLVHQVSAEMFTAMGASLQAIGYTALYGFFWNWKGLWSPFIEVFSTTRRWILALELALVIAVGTIGWFAGRNDLASMAVALAAVAFLGATQDIAIDGYYLRTLDNERQASLSGLRVGAFRVAMLVGKGLLVLLAGLTSWRVCFLASAGIMLALTAFHAAILPKEIAQDRRASGGQKAFIHAFVTFFQQPGAALSVAFIVAYRAGDAMMFAMSPPLLKSLGLGTSARATLSGVVGTGVSVAGSMLGAAIIARFGLTRTLRPIALLQSLALVLYVWLAWAKPGVPGIAAIVLVEQLAAGVGTAALMVYLMRRSAGEFKTAHFAIGTSLMSVGTTLLGTASGHIAASVGFVAFFAIAFAASLPGVILSFRVPSE